MQSVLYTINVSPHEYRGRVPLPAVPRVEGHPGAAWDRHVLIVDSADCSAYELIQYDHTLRGLGPRTANSGAKYSLSSTDRVKFTTNSPNTSAPAAMIMSPSAMPFFIPVRRSSHDDGSARKKYER
jgi:hypothetical protein